MRLITYQSAEGPRVGVLDGERVRPVPGMDMLELIRQGEAGLARAAAATETELALKSLTLLAPIPRAAAQHRMPGDELRGARRGEPARQEPADQDAGGAGVLHQGDDDGERAVRAHPLRPGCFGEAGLGGGAGGGDRQAGQEHRPHGGFRLHLRLHRAKRHQRPRPAGEPPAILQGQVAGRELPDGTGDCHQRRDPRPAQPDTALLGERRAEAGIRRRAT